MTFGFSKGKSAKVSDAAEGICQAVKSSLLDSLPHHTFGTSSDVWVPANAAAEILEVWLVPNRGWKTAAPWWGYQISLKKIWSVQFLTGGGKRVLIDCSIFFVLPCFVYSRVIINISLERKKLHCFHNVLCSNWPQCVFTIQKHLIDRETLNLANMKGIWRLHEYITIILANRTYGVWF